MLLSELGGNSSANSTNTKILFQIYPTPLLNFTATCCIVFTIFGILGNSLTILALLKSPLLKNATSAFIINLCIVDGLYCSFNFPLAAFTFIHKTWPFGDLLCNLFPLMGYANIAVSTSTVITIAVNRYVIIVHPRSYNKIYTKTTIIVTILCLWLWSFLSLVPTSLEVWGKFGFNPDISMCTILETNGKSPKRFFYFFAFVVPIFVFIYCYTRIFLTVRKSGRLSRSKNDSEQETESSNNSMKNNKGKKKLTKDLRLLRMILVIFIIFLISYTPIVFVKLFRKEKDLPILTMLGIVGIYSTAIVNPIIYVVMSKSYRKAYINLFVRSKKSTKESKTPT
ncbi:protein trapped in endoderm-1-like [Centruroides sculpturatus]|uniref:protein trapped in endoderm-1-like n=1 Tax=Centruroides sculpturatus TaxID=218467 RepID=UPI000C6CFE21|nr:protein trapped in endoderm-1-like [Centruroides sculpturatus]